MASGSKGGRQYGLILQPAKQKKQLLARTTIFDDDHLESSDSDDHGETNLKLPVRKQEKPLYPARSSGHVQSVLNKALEEDPNVFAYDEVYDDIKGKKEVKDTKKSVPKYMNSLMKSAELRKREQERREERKIQKEREEEGDQFADKEAFITPAYKEKLEELKRTEEREKKEEAFEAALDVTKQRDLSGFYRHLLNQSVGEEKVSLHSISDRFEEKEEERSTNSKFKETKRNTKNRQIRQRKDSSSSSSEDEKKADEGKEDGKNNGIATKSASYKEKGRPSPRPQGNGEEKVAEENSKGCETSNDLAKEADSGGKGDGNFSIEEARDEPPVVPKVQRVDRRALVIERFTKRTIGKVLEEARQRYLERKASSTSASSV